MTILDRWIDVPPDVPRIEVTGDEYMDLIEGNSITRASIELVLEDGPFKIVRGDQITQGGRKEGKLD